MTAVCTMCGAVNEEYVDSTTGCWRYVEQVNNDEIKVHLVYFKATQDLVSSRRYISLDAKAAKENKTVEEIKAQYGSTYAAYTVEHNGKEYIYDGSLGQNIAIKADAEENGVVKVYIYLNPWNPDTFDQAVTATLTRTGLAEFTVTSGDYFETGTKFVPM